MAAADVHRAHSHKSERALAVGIPFDATGEIKKCE
jgi:hypothetical protein